MPSPGFLFDLLQKLANRLYTKNAYNFINPDREYLNLKTVRLIRFVNKKFR